MAVDPAERLLNLIIALSHARVRMTRAQIRASVAGYEPAVDSPNSEEARKRDAAFERMFERDKDELRRMGIPLKTVTDPTHGDEIGYKIDVAESQMPVVEFTAAEAAVVSIAAEYWQGAVLDADAQRGLIKVASTTADAPRGVLGLSARRAATADHVASLVEARSRRQAVEFVYESAASGTATRTVEPWMLITRAGAEYLFGWDKVRQEPRTFRLSRIAGEISVIGPEFAYVIPDPLPAAAFEDGFQTHRCVVGLRPEAGHALRARGKHVGQAQTWDLLELEFSSVEECADEVLKLAGNARAVAPQELVELVTVRAAAAAAAARASLDGEHG